jgi:hypothetical protein
MKNAPLLAPRFRWIGLALFIPFAILGALNLFQDFEFAFLHLQVSTKDISASNQNLTDEVALTGCIIGLLLVSFARVRFEDEFIHLLRLEAWQWAVLIHFVVLLIGIWTVYDFGFLYIMIGNMLTVLVIFLLRFHYLLYRQRITQS